MDSRTSTRTAAVGLLAAAALLATSNAQAMPVQRPDPATLISPVHGDLRETILRLLDESRQATTVAQRRLIHHELVESLRDGE
jgi:hypothetical protein